MAAINKWSCELYSRCEMDEVDEACEARLFTSNWEAGTRGRVPNQRNDIFRSHSKETLQTRDMPAPTHKPNPPMCCHINNLSRQQVIIKTTDERRLPVFVPRIYKRPAEIRFGALNPPTASRPPPRSMLSNYPPAAQHT